MSKRSHQQARDQQRIIAEAEDRAERRHAADLAAVDRIVTAATRPKIEATFWPSEILDMSSRISNEGPDRVPNRDRNRLIDGLPLCLEVCKNDDPIYRGYAR